jgi:hypothetical protein
MALRSLDASTLHGPCKLAGLDGIGCPADSNKSA